MKKSFFITGSIFGLLAVIFGAFATHGLQPKLSAGSIASFETGIKFQMYHALLFLVLGHFAFFPMKLEKAIFYLLLCGILCFSGSIYFLATNELTTIDFTSIALITPFGGVLIISAWVLVVIAFIGMKY